MISLPTEKVQARTDNPHFMILFGKPKTGKTTIAAALDSNLIIDLEGGSQYMDALAIQARTYEDLANIANALRTTIKETGKFPYKRITIDSGSVLEDIAKEYALRLYQRTPAAKRKDGSLFSDPILTLPNGGGYWYLRTAMEKLYTAFFDLAESVILICHCKNSLINEDGKEMSEMSMDLTGKIANIAAGKADAVGFIYRKKNQTFINFKSGGNIICGARPKHLREREFVVAESDEKDKVHIDWTNIFLPEEDNQKNN